MGMLATWATAVVGVAEVAVGPTKAGPSHWAFQPIQDPNLPAATASRRSTDTPVDRFIVARLTEQGLNLAPEATRRVLIRRAAYDLTGLPPTPEDIKTFLDDPAPDAFERMIDRYLSSPRYGERWGRWWLDVARYADTNGQDENKVMANAWRYRDWVIRSFNANQRFDSFITEQLAGDLLSTNGVSEQALFDRWTATGFLVLGPKMLAEQDKPKLVMDMVDEQIDVVSRAFLGLTVGCARCHDHKFDPIPARDYYALAGIFKSTKTMANLSFVSKFNERRITSASHLEAISAHEAAVRGRGKELEQAVQKANADLLAGWRNELGSNLAAAGALERGTVPPNASSRSSSIPEVVNRLRERMIPDPKTNSVSRILRRLKDQPAALEAFLAKIDPPATNAAAQQWVPGRIGAAFLATGHNYLEIPSSPELEPAHLTVEAWMRASEFPTEGDARRWLVSKNANEETQGHYALMLDHNRAGAYLNIGGGRENIYTVWSSDPVLKPDQWYHLALTYDGSMLRLFMNGQLAGETAVNRPRVPGTGPLVLGRRPDGFVNFKGTLDEVRVHRRALAAAEVKDRFEHPETPSGGDVVARWDFNDLSESEREALAFAETRDALFGPGGVLALPKDPRPLYPASTREAINVAEKALDALKSSAPPPLEFALAVEEDKPVDLPVHLRGSHLNLAKDPVPRGFVQVAFKAGPTRLPAEQSGRLELAHWLTGPDNPLTARVIVNRIWQAHFGEGLVRSPDNFGVRGEVPSHPELLDWLARELMRTGWDVKRLHRLILSSATWRQSGGSREEGRGKSEGISVGNAADPDDRLLWHFPRQRLEAEMIRDALLAVSGRLDVALGGSLVDWKNDEYTPNDAVSAASVRRSVYLPIVRDRVFDVFTIFDFANPSVGTSKRTPTVVSHQALFFLNSPLVKESARGFAESLRTASASDLPRRVGLAYERAFGRLPTPAETDRALEFVRRATRGTGSAPELAAWTAWCQMLFAANEFVYRE